MAHNIPSFSLVRYQQGWLVVFRTYVTAQCQVVYAYRGELADTPQCSNALFSEQANGQCKSPINNEWQVSQEWFLAESLKEEAKRFANELNSSISLAFCLLISQF